MAIAENHNPVLISSVSLGGFYLLSLKRSIELAKEMGFDGVEIYLNNRALKNLPAIARMARVSQMEVTYRRWHNTPALGSRLLTRIRIIPPRDKQLRDFFRTTLPYAHPVTIPSWRWQELGDFKPLFVEPDPYGYQVASFRALERQLESSRAEMSFDPLRWIEYYYGINKPMLSVGETFSAAITGFDRYKHQIRMIRLYDFSRPFSIQNRVDRERYLFAGEGIFPLEPFLEHVKSAGWKGIFVWHIHPSRILNPRNRQRYRALAPLVRSAGL